ncbi:MAG TPA: GTP 3',8-cyclase MoaA, partial [Firmicutes bacterium]|nr:GTP 3',8-cyclase MoaA [Bacillota bacterium]
MSTLKQLILLRISSGGNISILCCYQCAGLLIKTLTQSINLESGKGGKNMEDRLGRKITYLRVSVTERCNLRCLYCRPESDSGAGDGDCGNSNGGLGAAALDNESFLRIIAAAAALGVKKIRLTGGEPLVYPDLAALVAGIRAIAGIEEITLTTNGLLLAEQAGQLKAAGLDRVNISMDSLEVTRFAELTRGGDLKKVLQGMAAAMAAGLSLIKLNVVLVKGVNDCEISDFATLTMGLPIQVRFLELMPFGIGAEMGRSAVVSADEVIARLPDLIPVEINKAQNAGPARVFRLPGARGTIGFISPVSSCFCPSCNRLRLTSNGLLQPCLFSAEGIDIGTAARSGVSSEELSAIIRRAVLAKPEDWRKVAREIPDRCGRCALGRP